jgi:uncharacterized protein YutE (UPF0331/DUF86 family)
VEAFSLEYNWQHSANSMIPSAVHRGAGEHLGEAYPVLGKPATAEQMLTELQNLCLIPCEEYDDLKQAIAVYKQLASAEIQIDARVLLTAPSAERRALMVRCDRVK